MDTTEKLAEAIQTPG